MIIQVSGADVSLFHVAAAQYGDATQWITLAVANGLTDPRIIGTMQLYVPAVPLFPTGGIQQQ